MGTLTLREPLVNGHRYIYKKYTAHRALFNLPILHMATHEHDEQRLNVSAQ